MDKFISSWYSRGFRSLGIVTCLLNRLLNLDFDFLICYKRSLHILWSLPPSIGSWLRKTILMPNYWPSRSFLRWMSIVQNRDIDIGGMKLLYKRGVFTPSRPKRSCTCYWMKSSQPWWKAIKRQASRFLSINSLKFKCWYLPFLYDDNTGEQRVNEPLVDLEPNVRDKYSVSDL